MAINLSCPVCYKTYKLGTSKCTCGNNLSKNRLYKVRVKLPTGKWKSKQVHSLEMAKKVEAKFKTQAIEEAVFDIKHSDKQALLIYTVWDEYLKWAKLNKRSWQDDEQRWNKHIALHLQGLRMDAVNSHHIQRILNKMADRKTPRGDHYKPATIKHVLVLMKHVFNWGIKQGYYHPSGQGINPCNSIQIPKFDNRITNPLDKAGLRALMTVLNSWKNERAVLVIKFSLYSGKRKSEVLSLSWDTVDLENDFITFKGTNTKSKNTQTLPINKNCKEILLRCKELRISNLVFPSTTGKYYNTFDETWRRIKKQADINIRFHDLRHTYASYLASSGKVDIYTLKELLGHSTIEMTQRYAHLVNGALKKAVCVADEVF